ALPRRLRPAAPRLRPARRAGRVRRQRRPDRADPGAHRTPARRPDRRLAWGPGEETLMAKDTKPQRDPMPSDETAPAVRDYTIAAITAALLVGILLYMEGLGWWALLPVLLGSLTALARWSVGPALMLLTVTGGLVARNWLVSRMGALPPEP